MMMCGSHFFPVSHVYFSVSYGYVAREAQRILERAYFFCLCIEYSDSKGASYCKEGFV